MHFLLQNIRISSHVSQSKYPISLTYKPTYQTHSPFPRIVVPANESILHEDCIHHMTSLGWNVVAHEWSVTHGKLEHGVGDLVFQKHNMYLVIECKRRKSERVYEQAKFYAAVWRVRHPCACNTILYGVWTSYQQDILGIITSRKEARALCGRKVCREIFRDNVDLQMP